jgi:hypothetical protein
MSLFPCTGHSSHLSTSFSPSNNTMDTTTPSAHLPDFRLLLEALQVPSSQRSKIHLGLIMRHIQSVAFFQKLAQGTDSSVLLECSKSVMLERRSVGDFVYKIGDFGSDFYVVLQGRVQVMSRVE